MLVKVKPKFLNPANPIQEAECSSTEDVLNIPWVRRWLAEPTFWRIYKSTMKNNQHLLLIETNRGKMHWPIAYLTGDIDELTLPEWKTID